MGVKTGGKDTVPHKPGVKGRYMMGVKTGVKEGGLPLGVIGLSFGILILALFLSGCVSQVGQKIQARVLERVDTDLERTAQIAEKWDDPDGPEAKCANYLQGALAGKRELLEEKTAGIISRAYKARLLRDYVLKDEAAFKEECGAFATDLLIEVGKLLGR